VGEWLNRVPVGSEKMQTFSAGAMSCKQDNEEHAPKPIVAVPQRCGIAVAPGCMIANSFSLAGCSRQRHRFIGNLHGVAQHFMGSNMHGCRNIN